MAYIYSICDLSRLFAIIMIKANWAKHLLSYRSLALILVLLSLKRRWYILAERCLCRDNLLKYLMVCDWRTSRATRRLITITTFPLYGTIDTLCLFLNSNAISPDDLSQIRSWLSFFQWYGGFIFATFIIVVALGSTWFCYSACVLHNFGCWKFRCQIRQLWLLCHSYGFLDKRLFLSCLCSSSLL